MAAKVWLEVWPGPTHEKCPCGLWPWRSVERARRAVDRGDETGDYIVSCSISYARSLHVVSAPERGQIWWSSRRDHFLGQGWSVRL